MVATNTPARVVHPRQIAMWLLALISLLSLALTIFDYFDTSNGIHGTAGVMLVIVSTALMLIASLVIALWVHRGWVRGVLLFLIVLDIVCTAAAGYFLESDTLMILMLLALICWLGHVFARPPAARLRAEVTP